MSAAVTEHAGVLHAAEGARTRRPKRGRYFFAVAALIMLALMAAGFHPYYLRGKGMGERTISPELATLVFVHGAALSAWLLFFLVQSLLVPARRVRVHMRLGWCGILVAVVAATSGFMLAVQSVRPVPTIPFWGMTYQQFLLVMLSEVALFSLFVIAGVLLRKRPKLHKSAMLLASLSILAGATVRMPVLFPVFGEAGSLGIFGPILTLGAMLVLVRSVLNGATDRGLTAGYVVMAVILIAVSEFAVTDAGSVLAGVILRLYARTNPLCHVRLGHTFLLFSHILDQKSAGASPGGAVAERPSVPKRRWRSFGLPPLTLGAQRQLAFGDAAGTYI